MSTWARIRWFLGGAFAVIAVGLGVVAWQWWSLRDWHPAKDWRIIGPIAVSSQWSVALAERPSHPFLAEYDYRLEIFTSEGREGRHYGTVDLLPNTGGRTFLCLYTLSAPGQPLLLALADRMDTSIVDPQALRRLAHVPVGYEARFLGAFVEEALPLRFVSPGVKATCPAAR